MKRNRRHLRCSRRVALILVLLTTAVRAAPDEVTLHNAAWRISVAPQMLCLCAEVSNGRTVELSAGQSDLGTVTNLRQTEHSASWDLGEVTVQVRLDGSDLHVRILAAEEGAFTWPVVREQELFQALIWPRAEGTYIPLDNRRWTDYLISRDEWDTLASLSMPFWGLQGDDFTLTYIATCPYNNTVRFTRDAGGLKATFAHAFTRFQEPKEYGFIISLGQGNSPVAPAQR